MLCEFHLIKKKKNQEKKEKSPLGDFSTQQSLKTTAPEDHDPEFQNT